MNQLIALKQVIEAKLGEEVTTVERPGIQGIIWLDFDVTWKAYIDNNRNVSGLAYYSGGKFKKGWKWEKDSLFANAAAVLFPGQQIENPATAG